MFPFFFSLRTRENSLSWRIPGKNPRLNRLRASSLHQIAIASADETQQNFNGEKDFLFLFYF
jgi:hypothetical protein